jgi:thioester reductase-like protein
MKVFITGVTGLLGGEMLVNLSARKEIEKIYCLIRSDSYDYAINRLQSVFSLHHDKWKPEKIIPVVGDLNDDMLMQQLMANATLNDINCIVHSAANTSFSRIHNLSVERINIQGLEKILLWAKQLTKLQTFLYIGTATICGKDKPDRLVQEDESPNTKVSHLVHYTYTKMMGELLIRKHLSEDKILIARPSIIMGDSRKITPRSPVILWALATVNYLRLCTFRAQAHMDCIPVDYASNAIIGLLFAKRNHQVYHISSGRRSNTTPQQIADVLTPFFPDMPPYLFVDRSYLDVLKKWARNAHFMPDELRPFSDYLSYWEDVFGDKSALRIIFAGLEPYVDFIEMGHTFDNSRLLSDTGIAPSLPAHEYLMNSVEYLKKIDLLEGALQP